MAGKSEANVTIKSIAEELGVSFSTVAKALNNDPLVKEETRERVREKAAQLGYLPNSLAKGLRSKTSKTVGVILNDIENPTRTHIVKKISVDLAKYGYTTLIFDSLYDLSIERKNLLTVLSRLPDCVVISPVSVHAENLSLLSNMYDRTVILSRMFDAVPANYVHMDHRRGGYISAKTMLENGHSRNIIFVEPSEFPSSDQFLEGVKQAYQEHGVSFNEVMMVYGTPSLEVGYQGLCDLLDQNTRQFKVPTTGVIASCDLFAFGVYRAAAKFGIRIPDDLSIIGYDDNPMAALSTPPLTTMYMPKEAIASHCSEILISKLINKDPVIKSYSLEPYLVQRDSIKKIN
ncbi:MAG: LacI family transcriptional regulator [Leptolinea sp.]|jgi:LacI family transcriptional regulator|nr:LacI family transcriptional regulator [Leptolinea sp.]